MTQQRLLLGSSSPERFAILEQICTAPFEVSAPDVDESLRKGEAALAATLRLAKAKMAACLAAHTEEERAHAFIITADTLALCRQRILSKTHDESIALRNLTHLSGRRHTMITTVCVRSPTGIISHRTSASKITFKPLTACDIDLYMASGEWAGKAGGYGLTGMAERFILSFQGSISGARGLPAYETISLLQGLGFRL